EGIVWEGQILITGDETDLAALLIVTHEHLAFVRGGAVALEIDRDWLDPAPVLRRTGTVQLWVSPPGEPIAESLTFIARDGRDEAAVLLSLIEESDAFGSAYPLPRYVPDSVPPSPEYPVAPSRRNVGWDADVYEPRRAPLPVYSLLDDDDFPPLSTENEGMPSWEEAIAEALEPGQILPLAGSVRNPNDPLRPIEGFDSKLARDRRSWVIRLVGMFVLVGIGSIIASGLLPSVDDLRDLVENDKPTPMAIAQNTEATETPALEAASDDPTATATMSGPSSSAPRDPTVVPAETAVALGVGGDNSQVPAPPPTETVEPAATETVTSEQAQSASGNQPGEDPATTGGTAADTEVAVIPDPDETFLPSPTPSATAEPQPTETATTEAPAESTTATSEIQTETGATGVGLDGLRLTIDELYRGERLPDLTLGRNSVGEWVVILVQVTNDTDGALDLPMDAIQLSSDGDPTERVPLDSASSAVASFLGMTPTVRSDSTAVVPAGGVQSLALVFSIPLDSGDLTLHFGDQPFDLTATSAADATMQIETMSFDLSTERRDSENDVLVAASSTSFRAAFDFRFAGWLAGETAVDDQRSAS
ncbi:MAG: hypothetical protein AB7V46_06855, partial [Thermomicrobiales bacterium]